MFVDHGLKAEPALESLEGLIAWLETQPANVSYDWPDVHGCLVCKYLQARTGLKQPAYNYLLGSEPMFFGEEYRAVAQARPWTFGAALTRARAVLAAR